MRYAVPPCIKYRILEGKNPAMDTQQAQPQWLDYGPKKNEVLAIMYLCTTNPVAFWVLLAIIFLPIIDCRSTKRGVFYTVKIKNRKSRPPVFKTTMK